MEREGTPDTITANGNVWSAADIAMLKLTDVPSHGVGLPSCTRRDRLRQGGLIVGYRREGSRGKRWFCTSAGLDTLRRRAAARAPTPGVDGEGRP